MVQGSVTKVVTDPRSLRKQRGILRELARRLPRIFIPPIAKLPSRHLIVQMLRAFSPIISSSAFSSPSSLPLSLVLSHRQNASHSGTRPVLEAVVKYSSLHDLVKMYSSVLVDLALI